MPIVLAMPVVLVLVQLCLGPPPRQLLPCMLVLALPGLGLP